MTPSRIVLLPQSTGPASDPHAAKLRRYRLARLRVAERRDDLPPRHAHLLSVHD